MTCSDFFQEREEHALMHTLTYKAQTSPLIHPPSQLANPALPVNLAPRAKSAPQEHPASSVSSAPSANQAPPANVAPPTVSTSSTNVALQLNPASPTAHPAPSIEPIPPANLLSTRDRASTAKPTQPGAKQKSNQPKSEERDAHGRLVRNREQNWYCRICNVNVTTLGITVNLSFAINRVQKQF